MPTLKYINNFSLSFETIMIFLYAILNQFLIVINIFYPLYVTYLILCYTSALPLIIYGTYGISFMW